jgi:hypothetical protein
LDVLTASLTKEKLNRMTGNVIRIQPEYRAKRLSLAAGGLESSKADAVKHKDQKMRDRITPK